MSERGFDSTMQTALAGPDISLALLVFLDWPGGAGYYWTGVGSLSWNSQTWTGVGDLGRIDKVADSLDKADIGVDLVLNLLNDTIRNEIVTNDPRGEAGSIYVAAIDAETLSVDSAYEYFPGFIDRVEIEDAGSTGSIRVRLVSELARMRKPRHGELTDAYQQWLFPGDLGCEFATKMDEAILWGRKPVNVGGGGGGTIDKFVKPEAPEHRSRFSK